MEGTPTVGGTIEELRAEISRLTGLDYTASAEFPAIREWMSADQARELAKASEGPAALMQLCAMVIAARAAYEKGRREGEPTGSPG
jgi:hypothetical protein